MVAFEMDVSDAADVSPLFPPTLTHLRFVYDFTADRLVSLLWSASLPALVSIRFGSSFNWPVDNLPWPASLTSIEFGEHFDQQVLMSYRSYFY